MSFRVWRYKDAPLSYKDLAPYVPPETTHVVFVPDGCEEKWFRVRGGIVSLYTTGLLRSEPKRPAGTKLFRGKPGPKPAPEKDVVKYHYPYLWDGTAQAKRLAKAKKHIAQLAAARRAKRKAKQQ